MNQIVTVTSRGQVVIPARLRQQIGLMLYHKVLMGLRGPQEISIKPIQQRSVMSVYQAVNPGRKSADPAVAIARARRQRAKNAAE